MANDVEPGTDRGWKTPQVYAMAGICLVVGLALGYLFRGSASRPAQAVQAAQVTGAGSTRIVLRHVLPNCMGPLLVQLTFTFAYAIWAEATLSFLGVGAPPPTPNWSNIIAEGRDFAVDAWWIILFLGVVISLAALGMNLLGDALRDVLDPRLKVEA